MPQLMVSLCVGVTATPVHEMGNWEISEFLSDNHMSSLKTLPNIDTRGDSIYYLKYSFIKTKGSMCEGKSWDK